MTYHANTKEIFRSADEFGIPLEFDNASDYLFARLFLHDNSDICIPWEYCNAILSTVQDPRFDSRKVTFKDCGEMYARVGSYRDRAWSVVEARSLVGANSFPQVVLDGVFDIIEEDLRELGPRVHPITLRKTLGNMALVHPSWHRRSRRLFGLSIRYSTLHGRFSPHILQRPTIGGWTRELHITYDLPDKDHPFARNLPEYDRQFQNFVDNLCSRAPAIRSLTLVFCGGWDTNRNLPDAAVQEFYRPVLALKYIEHLTIKQPNLSALLIRLLTETPHDILRTIRFIVSKDLESSNISSIFYPFSSLPRLRSIMATLRRATDPPHVVRYMGLPLGSSRISANGVTIGGISSWNVKRVTETRITHGTSCLEVLPLARGVRRDIVRFDFPRHAQTSQSEDDIVGAISPLLKLRTTTGNLALIGLPWAYIKVSELLRHRGGIPPNVRSISITSIPPMIPLEATLEKELEICSFPSYDEQLSQTIRGGLAPDLKRLSISFADNNQPQIPSKSTKNVVVSCARHYAEALLGRAASDDLEGPELFEHLLPLCKQRCSEGGIVLKVDFDSNMI